MDKRILILGDDPQSRKQLVQTLTQEELRTWAIPTDWSAALLSYLTQADLIILDVPPSETDRWGMLQQIRKLSTLPVIVLISADDYRIKVEGLDRGADYVMTRPVNDKELNARVGALLRRAQTTIQMGGNSRKTQTYIPIH